MNDKLQKGFTLIELMIVVAIIGILATIAIPQYRDYIAQAQAMEACSLLGGLKTPITEHLIANGGLPDLVSGGGVGNLDSDNLTLSGENVSGIAFDSSADKYTATLKSSGISDIVAGGKLDMIVGSDGGFTFSDGGGAKDLTGYAKCI